MVGCRRKKFFALRTLAIDFVFIALMMSNKPKKEAIHSWYLRKIRVKINL